MAVPPDSVKSRVGMEFLRNLSRFLKIEHTLFSLPVVFSGAFLGAGGLFGGRLFLLIALAGVGARTAALALNRILDREMDGRNPRTAARELPSARMSLRAAAATAAAGAALYLLCAWMICPLVFWLSPLPLAVFAVYPLMKRFTSLCHFGVGFALALAPLGGWLAATCSPDGMTGGILLASFAFFWVSGFDVIYATLDEESDRERGVFSLVARLGRERALAVSFLCHVLSFVCLVALYLLSFRTLCALFALLAAGFLLRLEHESSSDVNFAFFRVNVLVGFAVLCFVLAGIYLP